MIKNNKKSKEIVIREIKKLNPSFEYKESYDNNLNEILESLNNQKLSNVGSLSISETYVLRKKLGILAQKDAEQETELASMRQFTKSRLLRRVRGRLYFNLIHGLSNTKNEISKMSSVLLNDEYQDVHVESLNLKTRCYDALRTSGINTLGKLLMYSEKELKKLDGISPLGLADISSSIHQLGLKFIEELTEEEKRVIISKSTEEMIDNSSLIWISEQDKEKLHYNSIGGLKTVIKNGGEIPRETIERAHRIGIDLKRKESNMDTKENRSLKSKDLELLAQVYQALYESGLIVSSELIDKNIEDILKASNSELELTKIVMTHIQTLRSSYGDQASYLKVYADAIGSGIEKAVVKKI